MGYKDERSMLSRERRTAALSHFHGTVAELKAAVEVKIEQRIRTLAQAGQDEIIAALSVLSTIKDAALVVHGAPGCAASAGGRAYTTNLTESETILGGGDQLLAAVSEAAKGARAVFIVGTPVTAISNDDVASVMLELEEETPAKLVFIKTDGFQTKAAISGYDAVAHGLLRYIVEPKTGEGDFLNVISFSEGAADLEAALAIVKALGVQYNLLPRFSSIAAIRRASAAKATITLNPDEGEVLAKGLEEDFGVPYIQTPAPVGTEATEQFIAGITRVFGVEENIPRPVAGRPLAGKKVFISLELAVARGAISLVRELGGEVNGLIIPYIDEVNRSLLADIVDETTVIVGRQPFEIVNAISKQTPDFYVGGAGEGAFAARAGANPIIIGDNLPLLGFEGVRAIAQAAGVKALPGLFSNGAGYYKPGWLKKSGNWYVKREVS
ncbi:MAG TPA: nitrogenase component 1 [Negativicutes bacterium]|nr:nitrogenase component 1 [Negativicutes bacterium]